MTVKKVLDKLNPEVKRLQALVDKQSQQIDDLRKTKFRIPTGRRKSKGKTFVRVIIPDTHGAHVDKNAAKAFFNDLEHLAPKEVVMLGDHVDCGGFLAQHQPLSFLPECDYSYADDIAAANEFLDQTQKRTGKCDTYYIVGNHEARIQKWIVRQTLNNPKDASYLNRMFGLESSLGIDSRGLTLVERDKTYHGLRKRGTIKLGKCLFQHGTRCGIYAAKQALEDAGTNVVQGHTHRISSFVKETAKGVIGGWTVGCLCQLHPLYGDTRPSNWAHGYGIQIVGKQGEFLHLTVPIVEGVSYLQSLIGHAT